MRLALVAGVLAIGCGRPAPRDPYPVALGWGPGISHNFCEHGVLRDCHELAKKDHGRARDLYTKTCDAGSAEGCYRLSQYLLGDPDKLANVREQACDLGSDAACERYGLTPDVDRALAHYSKACDRGHPIPCMIVGRRDAMVIGDVSSLMPEIECDEAAMKFTTGYPSFPDLDHPVLPKGVAFAQQRYNALARQWTEASGSLVDHVSKLDAVTPRLERCFEFFDERRILLSEYGNQIARARRGELPRPPLLVELALYADSMRRLAALAIVDNNPARKTANVLEGLPLVEAKRVMTELTTVDQLCQERAPDAGNTFPTTFDANRGVHYVAAGLHVPADILEKADAWCYVGAKRVELMTEALARVKFVHAHVRSDDELALAFRDPEALKRSFVAEATMWANELGVQVPADVPAQAAELVRALRERGENVPQSGVMRATRTVRDARVEQLVATKLRRDDGSLVRGLRLSPYREVPEDRVRWRMGTVVSQRRGLPFCDERSFTYTERRVGGRWRSERGVELQTGSRAVSCR